jgi:hypothetical protein
VSAGSIEKTVTADFDDWVAARGPGDQWHPLTADVLHWVLSPGWSGQVPEGITFTPRR